MTAKLINKNDTASVPFHTLPSGQGRLTSSVMSFSGSKSSSWQLKEVQNPLNKLGNLYHPRRTGNTFSHQEARNSTNSIGILFRGKQNSENWVNSRAAWSNIQHIKALRLTYVHCSIIHNSKKVDTSQVFTLMGMQKSGIWYCFTTNLTELKILSSKLSETSTGAKFKRIPSS